MIFRIAPILVLLALWACDKGSDEEIPQPEAPAAIRVSPASLSVEPAGGNYEICVTAPARPKLSGLPEWIRLSDGTFKDYSITLGLTVSSNASTESRTAALTVSAAGATDLSFTITQSGIEDHSQDPGTDPEGWENAAAAARHMGAGWNLGNTLESNSGSVDNMWIEAYSKREPSDYETAWGQPVTTRELIHLFKEAGFGAIRVPVTWYPHMGTVTVSGTSWDMSTWTGYDVDPAWMARVKEVVGYVLDEGLYCILNVHHDTGDATTAWLRADKGVYESVRERYCALWTQIATEFASCGEKLLFEGFNEMLDARGSWNGPASTEAYEVINLYNAAFVATVRATGGNNLHRNLILNTYCAGPNTECLTAFRLPEDVVENHLLAEVHSYSPYRFAFDNDNPKTTFDAACETEVKGIVENLNTYLVSKGIPCVIGEYGCTSARAEAEIAKQAACYVSTAAKYDIACFYWMVLSEGADRSVPKWSKPTLKDAILKAYNDNKN